MLDRENLTGNTNWTHLSEMDEMSVKWPPFNSTLFNISPFILFSDKTTRSISKKLLSYFSRIFFS